MYSGAERGACHGMNDVCTHSRRKDEDILTFFSLGRSDVEEILIYIPLGLMSRTVVNHRPWPQKLSSMEGRLYDVGACVWI